MSDRIFVDTNILVYACDRSQAQKQSQALLILNQLVLNRNGVISTQVLAEFFVTVTNERKFASFLSRGEAYEYVQDYLLSWEVVEVTGIIVLEAARGVRDYQFSFWDAQIWATAKLNQIPVVYSEDFNVGATVEGISFINPLENSK